MIRTLIIQCSKMKEKDTNIKLIFADITESDSVSPKEENEHLTASVRNYRQFSLLLPWRSRAAASSYRQTKNVSRWDHLHSCPLSKCLYLERQGDCFVSEVCVWWWTGKGILTLDRAPWKEARGCENPDASRELPCASLLTCRRQRNAWHTRGEEARGCITF